MTKEMINNIGYRMVPKIWLVNTVIEDKNYENHLRTNPLYSEFVGMCQLLNAMGINYDFDYDETVTYITAITIEGIKFEV